MRLCGISSRFQLLSPCVRQVTHALLTRPPLSQSDSIRKLPPINSVRLACVKHAASVHPEPGSNSHVQVSFPVKIAWLISTVLTVVWFVLFSEISLEFSGLHYCLFVKVLCRCGRLPARRNVLYLTMRLAVCQQLFSLFLELLSKPRRASLAATNGSISNESTSVKHFMIFFCEMKLAHYRNLLYRSEAAGNAWLPAGNVSYFSRFS